MGPHEDLDIAGRHPLPRHFCRGIGTEPRTRFDQIGTSRLIKRALHRLLPRSPDIRQPHAVS